MTVYVFSYRDSKLPAMPIIDCRGIQDPANHTLTDEQKRKGVSNNKIFEALVHAALAAAKQGDVAIGCTHGQHRSVAVADEVVARYRCPPWKRYQTDRVIQKEQSL